MGLTYSTKKELKLLDAYDFDWEFNGKKGKTPMVVLYDYKEHRSYQLPYDCDLGACTLDDTYVFDIQLEVKYGKNKQRVVGVSNAG